MTTDRPHHSKSAPKMVVLLHGINSHSAVMKRMEVKLKAEGYQTLNINYPSTSMSLNEIADYLAREPLNEAFWAKHQHVSFVTHSMGGLVARRFMKRHPHRAIERMVMVAPPNQGSEIADLLSPSQLFHLVHGPAGAELTTKKHMRANKDKIMKSREAALKLRESLMKSDKPESAQPKIDAPHAPKPEIGIIAGDAGWLYPAASFFFKDAHDGRVSVRSTKLKGMKDHTVLNASHTLIMQRKALHDQVLAFLKSGKFQRQKPKKPFEGLKKSLKKFHKK